MEPIRDKISYHFYNTWWKLTVQHLYPMYFWARNTVYYNKYSRIIRDIKTKLK